MAGINSNATVHTARLVALHENVYTQKLLVTDYKGYVFGAESLVRGSGLCSLLGSIKRTSADSSLLWCFT